MKKEHGVRTISKSKKYILILLQVLAATCIGICVGIYLVSAKLTVGGAGETHTYLPDLGELRQSYEESDCYYNNLNRAIDDVARLTVIRSQMETNGDYDSKRIIDIGEFANRTAAVPYDGPKAQYYLEDLIRWAQYGVSHIYKEFDSWEEFDSFFGPKASVDENMYMFDEKEGLTYEISASGYIINGTIIGNKAQIVEDIDGSNDESNYSEIVVETDAENSAENDLDVLKSIIDNGNTSVTTTTEEDKSGSDEETNTIPMLDTIINRYPTVDGKALEDCVENEEEYLILCANLESTIESLYYNYTQYNEYKSALEEGNSNIRYLISVVTDGKKTVYTNTDWYYRFISNDLTTEKFKEYGSYLYMSLGEIKYQTNTRIGFEQVRNALLSYEYAYPDDTCVWIGIDNSYPADDYIAGNAKTYQSMQTYMPWLLLSTGLCLVIFIVVGVCIIICENRKYSYIGASEELGDFDKLPIEAELIFGALFIVLLYLINSILLEDIHLTPNLSYDDVLLNVAICTFLDTTVTLLFVYSFARRIKCRNVWTKSLASVIFKAILTACRRLRRWMWRVYDSAGVAIRTWATYAGFLLFNAFWAFMLFFGNHPFVALVVLIIIDGATGAVLFNQNWERKKIVDGIRRISEGDLTYQLDVSRMHGDNKMFADAVNDIGQGIRKAVETSTKDEKLKADLITNVSHDIKTPLTSIINYVDLIKRENVDNERIKNYVRVLDEKSQRLKQLTVDLVEASKITSGNITLQFDRINFIELLNQTIGEFTEKFDEKQLIIVKSLPMNPVVIVADSRRMWRIIENLFNNIYKYALESTRVYVDLEVVDNEKDRYMLLSLKNISSQQLNIGADELTERFIRGDVSRSTEGSGLGLSIAKSLTQAQKGSFNIHLDGDLFKVTVQFPLAPPKEEE